jgi:hypothetical protein
VDETMNWLRRLATNRLLDVAAILLVVSVVVLWAEVLPSRWSDFDFNLYYVGSRTLLEGRNPYTTLQKPMAKALGFRFSEEYPVAGYPPSFLWLFAPLAELPPRVAFTIWVASEIGCLVAILWLTHWLLREKLSGRGWLFVVVLAVCSRTVSYNLFFSQVQLLLAALVLAAYAAHRAGRHGWACLAVSTAGILKFYPFLLLPWFVWSGSGGLRARLYRMAGASGFVLAVMVLTGPGLWRDFFQYGLPMGVGEEIGRTFHFSLPALVTNLGYLYHDFRPSPEAKQWWWSAGTIVGLVVIAVAYGVCLKSCGDGEAAFCLLSVAMLIGTVTVQGHYFVFLVFPLTVAAIRVVAKPTPRKVVYLILLVVAVNCVDPPESAFLWRHVLLYMLVSNVPLYGLFGLGVFFWRELWARRALDDEAALTVKAGQ